MKNSVFVSIRPEYTSLIRSGEKDHEFRNYNFGRKVCYFFVYESFSACIKYILEVETPIEYPNQIESEKIGNKDFNNGSMDYKYAFPIKHVYELEQPLSLMGLKSKYHFSPPQKYTYSDKYPELTRYLEKCSKIQLY